MALAHDPEPVSLENQPSASALNVARCRAVAAHEPREEIRGADDLAEIFLGEEAQMSLKDPAIHAVILKKLAAVSPGGYEYFLARTAYLDAVVEQALRGNIPQIVFLGAGYDTRSFRFGALIQDTRIFELDSPATQQHKRFLLEQAHIVIPGQLTFIPIDFTKDRMADRLFQAGYARDKKTLFIWEGVSYYLPPQTVDDTLSFVRLNSPAGSILCFDYMISDTADRFGAQQARTAMQTMYTAEPLQFDLEEGQAAAFLAERGFQIVEHLTADDLQKRYLTLRDGSLAGRVLDLFGLVQASVLG
jgi:methyltransferase (TIGR00027 family)